MNVSPLCLRPLFDSNGNEIKVGQVVELMPGTRPYPRHHKVELHPAGFLKFVRDDGGYTYHARKNRTKTGYFSKGRFKSEKWLIVSTPIA